jgi:hypothetical protein
MPDKKRNEQFQSLQTEQVKSSVPNVGDVNIVTQ